MQDEEALFQAILDNPDDEALRLVYADFLEERGDPRAEFIRVQCGLAHLDAADPRRTELEAREGFLLAAHRREWDRPLHQILADANTALGGPIGIQRRSPGSFVVGWDYLRGFVEVIRAHGQAFLQFANTLFQLGPLQHVKIWGAIGVMGDLAGLVHLARLKTLDLSTNGLSFNDLRVLANSPYLARLTTLDLSDNLIGAEAIQGLRTGTFFGRYPGLKLIFESSVVGETVSAP
jgi:uncharacterized protein (TIGR02996 family)